MGERLRLIVGLGNPGPKYDQTRHNAGFWFVDEVARRHGARWRTEGRFLGETARVAIDGADVWLLKPSTYMNKSGQSVAAVTAFYKIAPSQLAVAHDEIDLPPGDVRFKFGGGHGGHNGLRDIFSHLGRDFWRVRLGVGHPGHRDQVIDYVLGRPGRDERTQIDICVDKAADLLPKLVAGDTERAMHALHSR
ncbi:MAG: aminoacyl-tRNA hydrolase [Acidihalobacter sp.]|uniref:aminoacyl-tRNA hydrolase n=1 Tax=Acidihalobacter sp. TaxID=1872108 RepID=UPI00307DBCB2